LADIVVQLLGDTVALGLLRCEHLGVAGSALGLQPCAHAVVALHEPGTRPRRRRAEAVPWLDVAHRVHLADHPVDRCQAVPQQEGVEAQHEDEPDR
jgi:hypothetical protein